MKPLAFVSAVALTTTFATSVPAQDNAAIWPIFTLRLTPAVCGRRPNLIAPPTPGFEGCRL